MARRIISSIRKAVREGRMHKDGFTQADFRRACPGHGEGVYNAFLSKHCEGYALEHGYTVLFARVRRGTYVLIEHKP